MPETFGAGFTIDIAKLKAGLSQANRLIRESESEFKAAAAGMDDWTESQEGLEARIKHLNNATDLQKKKIEALEKQYQENIKNGVDPMSASMVKLRTDINKEQAALNKNEKELRDQTDALRKLGEEADDAADEIRDVGESAKDAGDGFTIGKGAIAGFIANGLTALVSGCKNAISSLANLSETTREYREDIGKLQTAFETAGHSTELATKTYKDLYMVLGEEDRSVEAANHLAKFVDNEKDMAKWTDILTGVWGTFGDSLPIEGLTEAANETIRTKQVTGVLADAINWASKSGETFGVKLKENTSANEEWNKAVESATTAEEFFNIALQECSTEQERQALITETLNGLYSEASKNYKENNASIIEARKASSDYTDSVAELGERIEPVTTKVSEGFNKLLKVALDLTKKADFEKLGKKIDRAFDKIAEDILPAIKDGFEWVIDNRRYIEGALAGAFSLFIGTKLVLGVTKAITTFKTLFATITAFTTTNPIGLLATGVGLLVGGITALAIAARDEKTATEEAVEANREFIDSMNERKESYDAVVEAAEEAAAADLAELGQVEKLNAELKTLVDEKGKVKKGDEERVSFILNELNEAFGTEYKLVDGVVQKYADLEAQIDSVIEKKKAQIMLEPLEAAYTEAIKNQAGAQKDLVSASQEYADQQDVVKSKEQELIDLTDEWHKKIQDPSFTHGESTDMQVRIFELEEEVRQEKELLESREEAYKTAKGIVEEYFAAIEEYETAQGLVLSGKTQEAIDYMASVSSAFEEGQKKFEDANRQQAYQLEENAKNARTWADELEKLYKAGVEGVTKEAVEEAKNAAIEAETQWKKVGNTIVDSTAQGVRDSYSLLEQVAVSTANDAADSAIRSMRSRIMSAARSAASAAEEKYSKKTPKMATGGIVRSATNAIIGEAGTEAVLPLERNTSWMDTLADKLSSKMGGTSKTGAVVVNQTNNYSQAHSRYEIFRSKEATAKAVKLALREV